MDTSKLSAFERCALASGLLTPAQLELALAALGWADKTPNGPRPDGRELADKLVESGRLNPWQAQQLLDGRTRFTLGPYRIVDSIGQGGMGQVFKGVHTGTGQVGAIKILPRAKTTPQSINYFNREIDAHSKLDHPNLVRKLDSGHDGNVYYLVTEYVPGLDLRKFVRRSGPMEMSLAASIISQVAQGLQHAHEQNIVHRDVKPGNVLLTHDGHSAKLSDLGLAGSFGPQEEQEENDPRRGKIVGTADYLSPDHIKAPSEPKPSWDIYSLGCTFYYAVTGKVPFPGGSITEKAHAHCELQPLDPRRLNPGLSAEFVDVIADMMAKDPAQRIQSAADVVARLSPWTGAAIPATASEAVRARLRQRQRPQTVLPVAVAIGDTKTGFPQIPDLGTEPPSQSSQPTYSVAAADETLASLVQRDAPRRPTQLWKPLLALVVTPLLLVAAVLLLRWFVTLWTR